MSYVSTATFRRYILCTINVGKYTKVSSQTRSVAWLENTYHSRTLDSFSKLLQRIAAEILFKNPKNKSIPFTECRFAFHTSFICACSSCVTTAHSDWEYMWDKCTVCDIHTRTARDADDDYINLKSRIVVYQQQQQINWHINIYTSQFSLAMILVWFFIMRFRRLYQCSFCPSRYTNNRESAEEMHIHWVHCMYKSIWMQCKNQRRHKYTKYQTSRRLLSILHLCWITHMLYIMLHRIITQLHSNIYTIRIQLDSTIVIISTFAWLITEDVRH